MATLIEDLKTFTPKNDEEAADYALLLEAAHREEAYNRAWPAHFTASASINRGHGLEATLMAYTTFRSLPQKSSKKKQA